MNTTIQENMVKKWFDPVRTKWFFSSFKWFELLNLWQTWYFNRSRFAWDRDSDAISSKDMYVYILRAKQIAFESNERVNSLNESWRIVVSAYAFGCAFVFFMFLFHLFCFYALIVYLIRLFKRIKEEKRNPGTKQYEFKWNEIEILLINGTFFFSFKFFTFFIIIIIIFL